jgi:hypothetical protein
MIILLSESFGSLGAVDPYRFRDFADEAIKRRIPPTFTVDGEDFASKYLELLIREFQEAEDTTDFDYCACLIQQVLKHFAVAATNTNKVWMALPSSSRELVEPLLISKYKVDKELPKPNLKCPIYRSDSGRNFEQWLSNWLGLMIACVKEGAGSGADKLFKFSKYMIPRNSRVASFLLPFVASECWLN